jgi:hypothetical protein
VLADALLTAICFVAHLQVIFSVISGLVFYEEYAGLSKLQVHALHLFDVVFAELRTLPRLTVPTPVPAQLSLFTLGVSLTVCGILALSFRKDEHAESEDEVILACCVRKSWS